MSHEAKYLAEHPKPDSDADGQLFEWYAGLAAAMCDDINALPPDERDRQVRIVKTGLAARRLNRGEFH